MITIFIIIGGILVTGLLAYAIVNNIPKKFHWIISILLILLAIFLVYKINFEIQKPMKFNKEKKVRYAKVIEKLKIIRDAQVDYKKVTGNYTNNGDNLIKFIDTAEFAITETNYIVETITLGNSGITDEISVKKVDTIGYEPVKDKFSNVDYKNMMNIPGTDEKFKIEIGEIEKIIGLKAQVFEIKVDKALILDGEDINLVKQEKEAIGGEEVRGEFLRVGSLEEVSEEGNWPPYYDKRKDSEE